MNKSHVDLVVISIVLADIDVEYGSISKMTWQKAVFTKKNSFTFVMFQQDLGAGSLKMSLSTDDKN